MNRHARKLRDQAARPTLRRIRADRLQAPEEVQPLLAVIETRLFDDGFDVNRLWRESGVKKWVAEPFAEHLDLGPGAYIRQRRLEVGAALLAGTDLRIFEVADVLGYCAGRDTFSKAFQRTNGTTPRQYRAEAQAHGAASLAESDPAVADLIDEVERATSVGDVAGARHGLARADALLRDQSISDLAARLGVSLHERGALRTRAGDVDRAYDDLDLARGCYDAAGELPAAVVRQRRCVPVSHDTDAALLAALCPDCRRLLAAGEGRSMRRSLRQALLLVPRDDPWSEASCDDCYRVAWAAISRARLGLTNDAWKAWWLSSRMDPRDRACRPSKGRFIAAMAEVERLYLGDLLERKEFADLAVEDAVALGDPVLEAESRLWLGAVLGAMSEFAGALKEINSARQEFGLAWLSALRNRVLGLLEYYRSNYPKALEHLTSSMEIYQRLDPHVSSLLVIQQANAYFQLADYEQSIKLNQKALDLIDGRRDPQNGSGIVPIHLAMASGVLGRWENAEYALSQCHFDRAAHTALAAKEILTRACLELLRGCPRISLYLFADAQERLDELHRPLDAAVAAIYSVEAYARLGDRARAIETAAIAFSFFQAVNVTRRSLDALGKIRALLEAEVVDSTAVVARVRVLSRQIGGWLPEEHGTASAERPPRGTAREAMAG